MAVSIRIEGHLENRAGFNTVIRKSVGFATLYNWRCEPYMNAAADVPRERGGRRYNYMGPLSGLVLTPHARCGQVPMLFDDEYFMQARITTQYADLEVHIRIIELFREVEWDFDSISVEDEGRYWDKPDRARLGQIMRANAREEETLEAELERRIPLEPVNNPTAEEIIRQLDAWHRTLRSGTK